MWLCFAICSGFGSLMLLHHIRPDRCPFSCDIRAETLGWTKKKMLQKLTSCCQGVFLLPQPNRITI